jgi:hypothetical protein
MDYSHGWDSKGHEVVVLTISHPRKRYGCDYCKRKYLNDNPKDMIPTEEFIGYCGNVLWICSSCWKKLSRKALKHEKIY